MRPPSSACSWLKRTDFEETAEYSFTGTLTRPKEMAPVQIERGIALTIPAALARSTAERRLAGPLHELGQAREHVGRALPPQLVLAEAAGEERDRGQAGLAGRLHVVDRVADHDRRLGPVE